MRKLLQLHLCNKEKYQSDDYNIDNNFEYPECSSVHFCSSKMIRWPVMCGHESGNIKLSH